MALSRQPSTLGGNLLLAALPRREQQRLMPLLEPAALSFGTVLYETAEPIRHIYFPTSGIVSLLMVLDDGSGAEVARVGHEGMVGLPLLLGVSTSQTKAFVQIPGDALRIGARDFLRQARLGGTLCNLLLRYAQALMGHTEQLTACNTWHTIEQRLCRWLLVTQDRVRADVIEVTQEFLSQMLGAHRQSVTIAAKNLQEAGLIRYSRGRLRILDRQGMKGAACECYRAIQRRFERLFSEIGTAP
jgi:CRP-like cAMP-binding protein